MAITLKFKTIAASLSGTALRQTLIDDANVIEAEANRVDTIVNGLAADVTAVWVSGTTYAINDFRRSPANFQIYRRLTAGAGTTDPSLDTTNWTESNNAEKTSTADLFADFVATGLLSPTSASLSTTLSAGVAYVIGSRVKKGADTFTYAASSDTYDDMSVSGLITHVAVANGAAEPSLTSSTLRLQKVVTSATAVTSVVAMARNLPVVTQDKVAYTTAGTATAYTLTPIPALTALAANQRFRVKFNATSGAAPTLAISGLLAKPLMYYNVLGVKVACGAANIIANMLSDVEYDGVDYVVVSPVGLSTDRIADLAVTTAKVADAAITPSQVKTKTTVALADAAATLTAAQLVNSGIFTITPTVARILTTDTAVNIVAALPRYQVGTWFDFTIVNTAAFDVTLAAGTGITLVGKMIANNASGTFKARIDSATAVTISSTAISAIATAAEAVAGTDNTKVITPLRMREGFNAAGSAPVFACRAWVNFDGAAATVAIRASGNVSSITDNGVGNYTVNFTTAMPDANCSVVATAVATGTLDFQATLANAPLAGSCLIFTSAVAAASDSSTICVAVFR